MTPPIDQSRDLKEFLPDTESADSNSSETVLLPASSSGADVYHTINPTNEPSPLCGTARTYQQVSLADAREHADRRCRTCAAIQDGAQRRPCPHCDELIPVTHWPQHVRNCSDPRQRTLDAEAFGKQGEQKDEQGENNGEDDP